MDHTYWVKQSAAAPLFPDLLWSRPGNRTQAGKLLIVGGNAYGFSAAGEAFVEATKAGIGTARVLLPDSLQKSVGKVFLAGEYAPSTPSGSFSQKALGEVLAMSNWADAVLLAGDFGRNSETAILLEQFASKYSGQLTITQDAVDYYSKWPVTILDRPETCLVLSFAQLQKLATSAKFTKPFKFEMDYMPLIETLHDFTQKHKASIVVKHLSNIFVSFNGQVGSTKLVEDREIWRVKSASHAAVWWLQNQSKPFESLTTSVLQDGDSY